MKKSLMMFTGMLFALSSVVASADHGGSGGVSSSGNGKGSQSVTTSPGSNDAAEPANENEPANDAQDDPDFLEFGSMVGVDGAFIGSDSLRGVVGAGLPWTVARARGSLSASGRLKIDVRGLVLMTDPAVPVAQQGTNPLATFRGMVSCASEASGATAGIVTVNVMTDPVPATPTGFAKIDATVKLPAQCLAPIVFVTNSAGDAWIAVIGSVVTGP